MFRRSIRRAALAVMMAYPLPGASESASYDGVYTLVSVDGQRLPFSLIVVDSRNKLVLTRGEWTLSGNQLSTAMWTTSVVDGTSTSEARFNPERHTGRVTISGNTATGTLDTGSPVSTTFETRTLLTTYNGHSMKFEKQ